MFYHSPKLTKTHQNSPKLKKTQQQSTQKVEENKFTLVSITIECLLTSSYYRELIKKQKWFGRSLVAKNILDTNRDEIKSIRDETKSIRDAIKKFKENVEEGEPEKKVKTIAWKDTKFFESSGDSKKKAEQNAAKKLLNNIKNK